MSVRRGTWKGRRKGRNRKIANDLRLLAPFLLLTFCFATSATAIAVVEWAPSRLGPGARTVDDAMQSVEIDVVRQALEIGRPR